VLNRVNFVSMLLATHPFSPTRTHRVIAVDEKCDVMTRNVALLSVRK
jgi:hypothetical protein